MGRGEVDGYVFMVVVTGHDLKLPCSRSSFYFPKSTDHGETAQRRGKGTGGSEHLSLVFSGPVITSKVLALSEPTFLHAFDGDNDPSLALLPELHGACLAKAHSPFSLPFLSIPLPARVRVCCDGQVGTYNKLYHQICYHNVHNFK